MRGAAFSRLRSEAEKGRTAAQADLGASYLFGLDCRRHPRAALCWLRKAAEKGNARAIVNLGYMYSQGIGVKTNQRLALKYYEIAAAGGNTVAQYNLGRRYLLGYGGVRQNRAEGLRLLRKAAKKGDKDAQELIQQGKGSGG